MTISKIFSDLPELTSEIIKYFRYDYSTLYSCILVNRLFCRIAIPLLWEDPFSIPTENYNFIKIYLNNLNEDDKMKLNEYGIDKNLFPSNTLFNYPKYIKRLNIQINYSIESWVTAINNKNCCTRYMCPPNSTRLIYKSLFKIFIENGAKLHTFDVISYVHREYLNDAFELILKNPNFIRNVKNLKLQGISNLPKIDSLLSNCYSISTLHFQFSDDILSDDILNINVLKEVFEQLNGLESVHILYCRSLNSHFIKQIVSITKPFKLRSLFLDEPIESLQLLLQKSNNYLENLGFRTLIFNTSRLLVENILSYCNNVGQNLNHLSIEFNIMPTINARLSSIVLKELGQILPLKLEYLKLSLKFVINNEKQNILSDIEELIIKRKRVKYLAFKEVYLEAVKDLFLLKDQVKKFELYDIKVQKYDDLDSDWYKYIEDTY
ncbi:hypothetical protein GLOIN_2v1774375 [Rhizophagus clarus]|uniref:F-box domain-containing protein n=1 Tax=Rhizophagus clarus TaxID=94130 RepID=A0A8H3L5A6_9GLOM|nr:hypothetical protein GLOIN_2v1774375 [Rhizophagus clarus]